MAALHELSAIELARAIAESEVSSREALDHFVDRVDRLDGPLNAVVTRDLDAAGAAADAADAATMRGESLGPLHGVPMTIKDSFSTVGMRTTSGAPELSDHVPDRGRRAGGRGARAPAPSSAARRTCRSTPATCRATTRSSARRTTRGTSSARPAAPRAARPPRWPPGSRRSSSAPTSAARSGCPPPCPASTATSRATASCRPTARSPARPARSPRPTSPSPARWPARRPTSQLALDLMSGPDRWNRPAWRLELPPPRATDLGQFRVATWFDDDACPLDPEVADAAAAASSSGSRRPAGRVDHEATPGLRPDEGRQPVPRARQAAVSGGFNRPEIEQFAAAEGDDPVAVTKQHTGMRHREWLSHNEGRLQLRRRFEKFFEDHDVLLLPVMPCVAMGHDHSEPMAARVVATQRGQRPYWELNRWMAPAGACFLPATVIPVGVAAVGSARRRADRRAVPPRPHHPRLRRGRRSDPGPCPTPPNFAG